MFTQSPTKQQKRLIYQLLDEVKFWRCPRGEREGKALSEADISLRSSQSHLPPKVTKQKDVARHLFVFYSYGASLLADIGIKDKSGYEVAFCAV